MEDLDDDYGVLEEDDDFLINVALLAVASYCSTINPNSRENRELAEFHHHKSQLENHEAAALFQFENHEAVHEAAVFHHHKS